MGSQADFKRQVLFGIIKEIVPLSLNLTGIMWSKQKIGTSIHAKVEVDKVFFKFCLASKICFSFIFGNSQGYLISIVKLPFYPFKGIFYFNCLYHAIECLKNDLNQY